jgi:hypothetical protein
MPDIDRVKVIKGLECCEKVDNCGNCPYDVECAKRDFALTRDAIALLREQEPRTLTVEEVKRIGADNHGSFKNDGPTVMWLEEFGKQFPLHVVILKWDEDDWQGEPNNIVNVYYFGTDEFDQFSLTDYNKAWRCWTHKPTDEQREAVKWDET